MSNAEDRLRIGQDRRCIFQNFCAGVTHEAQAETFQRSVNEIEKDIRLVARKIAEYRHRRCLRPAGIRRDETTGRNMGGQVGAEYGLLPPIPCETEHDIQINSDALLWTLQFLTDENLSTELLIIPTLTRHTIDGKDPHVVGHIQEAARAVHVHAVQAAA